MDPDGAYISAGWFIESMWLQLKGVKETTQSRAVSSCLHGGKAEWPNWTNNDRFCRPSLGRSLAWYTTNRRSGCQSFRLSLIFCCFLLWRFVHCILDVVYTDIPFLSFTTDRYSFIYIGSGFSFHYLVKLTFVGVLGQRTETWKGISTKDLSSFAARALKDANQQLDVKCWLHLRAWYCFGSYYLLGILTNRKLLSIQNSRSSAYLIFNRGQ